MKKRIVALLLVLSIVCTFSPAVMAYDESAESAARLLYELGLFKGKGTAENGEPIFALDDPTNRNEALVMLVRLLGMENEALEGEWEHGFGDVAAWMEPYVGFGVEKGIVNGMSESKYGGELKVTANMFLTFVLRALGYSDRGEEPDFSYVSAADFASDIGLVKYGCKGDESIGRDSMALISAAALTTLLKDQTVTLVEKLAFDGAVPYEKAENAGLLSSSAMAERGEVPLYEITGGELGYDNDSVYTCVKCEDILELYPGAKTIISEFPTASYSVEKLGDVYDDGAYTAFTGAVFKQEYRDGRKEFLLSGEYIRVSAVTYYILDAKGCCIAWSENGADTEKGVLEIERHEAGWNAKDFIEEFEAVYSKATADYEPERFGWNLDSQDEKYTYIKVDCGNGYHYCNYSFGIGDQYYSEQWLQEQLDYLLHEVVFDMHFCYLNRVWDESWYQHDYSLIDGPLAVQYKQEEGRVCHWLIIITDEQLNVVTTLLF